MDNEAISKEPIAVGSDGLVCTIANHAPLNPINPLTMEVVPQDGENISSLEIEEVLYGNPSIIEAAVVAVPDEKWGEVPCAFVGLKEGAAGLDEKAVIAYCRENLAHFKCPHYVIFGPLAKTATGKVQKYLLRQQARDQLMLGDAS